jgi:hypothetical protein
MLGGTNYPRSPLDFYPTPPRATNAFLSVVEDDLEAMQFWEPFAGNGAIYNLIAPLCRASASSDINVYDGFDADALLDFFNIYPDGDAHEIAVAAWEREVDKLTLDDGRASGLQPPPRPMAMSEVESRFGFRPDCIISNPPYGKEADLAVRKALELMQAEAGYVAFLMRHEWDAAKGRADLIDHPAFMAKITLRFRPVWVERKQGKSRPVRASPTLGTCGIGRRPKAPHAKAEMYYAG